MVKIPETSWQIKLVAHLLLAMVPHAADTERIFSMMGNYNKALRSRCTTSLLPPRSILCSPPPTPTPTHNRELAQSLCTYIVQHPRRREMSLLSFDRLGLQADIQGGS